MIINTTHEKLLERTKGNMPDVDSVCLLGSYVAYPHSLAIFCKLF